MSPALPDPDLLPEFYEWVPLKRLVAWGIDTVLILLISVVVIALTAFTGLLFLPVLLFAVNLGYRTVAISRWSATPGMWLMAIELRTLSGRPLDRNLAFMHSLGFTVSMLIAVLQVISVVLMLTSARGQGLTDHLLGTTALNRAAAH
jgi:uncharacterized RDD family membrane protein YckC